MNRELLTVMSEDFQRGYVSAEIDALRHPRDTFVGPWFLGLLVGMPLAFSLAKDGEVHSSWLLSAMLALSGFGYWLDHRDRQQKAQKLESRLVQRWPEPPVIQ